MAIRFYKPITPGTRNRSVSDFKDLTNIKPEKSLLLKNHRHQGRNNRGIMTIRHRGNGHKRLYRQISFARKKYGVSGKVFSIEYDPNRNARISLIHYIDGAKEYILHPQGVPTNQTVISDPEAPIQAGNSLPLKNIPLGTEIHNIELQPGKGGQLVRSAGSSAQILAKEGDYLTIRLPSREVRLISKNCWATVGQVGNMEFSNIVLGKAGRNRWLGKRPKVRGSVMNPNNHPHGGGEAKAPIGRARPVTPWGKPTLGVKTRKSKRYSDGFILRRRK